MPKNLYSTKSLRSRIQIEAQVIGHQPEKILPRICRSTGPLDVALWKRRCRGATRLEPSRCNSLSRHGAPRFGNIEAKRHHRRLGHASRLQSSELWSAEIHFRFPCLGFIDHANDLQVTDGRKESKKSDDESSHSKSRLACLKFCPGQARNLEDRTLALRLFRSCLRMKGPR